jgi:hypothetical protein
MSPSRPYGSLTHVSRVFGFVPTPKWSPSGIDDTILLYIVMLIFSVWNARVTETRDRAVEPMMIIRLRWIIIHQ